jgi:Parvulin-like peptidyl-prolyl isomerase
MKNITKSLVLLCAAMPLANLSAAEEGSTKTPATKVSELFGSEAVAKAKGVSISRAQLDEAFIEVKSAFAAQGRMIPPEQSPIIEKQVLLDLIRIKLLNSRASDADKTEGKALAEKQIESFKKQAGTPENFEAQLKLNNLTEETLREKLSEKLIANAYVKRELKINVSDEEVKKFYDENPGQFERPELVRAAHVLISTQDPMTRTDLSDEQKSAKKKIAEDVLKRAKAGEDFAKLAKEYSEDPGSKDNGGEYTFPRGRMVREFETAAFSLGTNQVSDIVTTQFGYHIIKTYEKTPAKKVELSEAESDIKEFLTGQELRKQLPEFLEKVEKESNVEILDEKLKAVEIPKQPTTAVSVQE